MIYENWSSNFNHFCQSDIIIILTINQLNVEVCTTLKRCHLTLISENFYFFIFAKNEPNRIRCYMNTAPADSTVWIDKKTSFFKSKNKKMGIWWHRINLETEANTNLIHLSLFFLSSAFEFYSSCSFCIISFISSVVLF